jgi:osmotically inducible protein OsmC
VATTRSAHTVWEGNLLEGNGVVTFDSSGIGEQQVSWPSRAEQANGKTSPEELIAAAHSSCFSMALSHGLAGAGTPPTKLTTSADVTFQPGEGITGIHLTVEGTVPGLDNDAFVAPSPSRRSWPSGQEPARSQPRRSGRGPSCLGSRDRYTT